MMSLLRLGSGDDCRLVIRSLLRGPARADVYESAYVSGVTRLIVFYVIGKVYRHDGHDATRHWDGGFGRCKSIARFVLEVCHCSDRG